MSKFIKTSNYCGIFFVSFGCRLGLCYICLQMDKKRLFYIDCFVRRVLLLFILISNVSCLQTDTPIYRTTAYNKDVSATVAGRLEATTDAPGLYNAPIGFNVTLVGPSDNSSIYDYVFEAYERRFTYGMKNNKEDSNHYWGVQKRRWVLRNETLECNSLFSFDDPGEYEMRIYVNTDGDFMPIAKTIIKFSVSRNILGSIRLEQPGVQSPNPLIVSTKTEALLSFAPHDPHNFLNGTFQFFGWSFNGRSPVMPGSSIRYNFTEPVSYVVMLMVTVVNTTDPSISYLGAYSLSLKARDPIENFNVTGLTSIKHGDLLELELSCEGSPPYSYCWRFTHETVNVSNQTCVDPTVTTDCEFLVIRYFRKSGNYKLVVVLENEIKHMVDVININVFDSAAEPQLLPIIVPLICCCLALAIVVVALMYYIQTRRQHSIEVADFDFQQSDTYEFRTFIERVRDSFGIFCSRRHKDRRYSYTLIHAQVT